jgi:hypothetical protein
MLPDGRTPASPLPAPERQPAPDFQHPPELIALLEQLSGQWVDSAFYYSTVIDDSVLFPFQRDFYAESEAQGISYPGIHSTIRPFTITGTGSPYLEVFPLSMRTLSDGMVELTYNTETPIFQWGHAPAGGEYFDWCSNNIQRYGNRRILVDPSQDEINELTYYIDDNALTLLRYGPRDSSRYFVDAVSDGIKLRWFAGASAFHIRSDSIAIYRSAERGVPGERIFSDITPIVDAWYFNMINEFTDTTAESGHIYYYSIRIYDSWRDELLDEDFLTFGGEWQIRVDVDEVLRAGVIE